LPSPYHTQQASCSKEFLRCARCPDSVACLYSRQANVDLTWYHL
jgi:hypothetical protein